MADEPTKEVLVDTTKVETGKITFFGNISNKTPTILARVTKGLRYFSVQWYQVLIYFQVATLK